MVTHDERLLPVCDRVLAMQDGVLTEQNVAKDEDDALRQTTPLSRVGSSQPGELQS